MSNTKIELSKTPTLEGCPFCGSECILDSSSQAILCICCMYRSGVSSPYDVPTIDELVIDHNSLCERNRLGKAAEKFREKPPESKFRDEDDDYYDGFDAAVRACLDMLKVEGE